VELHRFDADPDPTIHFDADPDPIPNLKRVVKTNFLLRFLSSARLHSFTFCVSATGRVSDPGPH